MVIERDFTQVLVVLLLVLWAGYAWGARQWRREYEAVKDEYRDIMANIGWCRDGDS